jgi:ribonucleoside-diphosphate reductase alpha chain
MNPGPTSPHAEDAYEGEVPQNRRRMPIERSGITHKFTVNGLDGHVAEGYIIANTYADGKVGEIFIAGVGKEGSTLDGFVQWGAMLFSYTLQFGGDLDVLCRKMAHMKFDPRGPVDGHPDIPYCHSIPAYIAEWLAVRFGSDEVIEQMRRIRGKLTAH